MTKSLIMVNVDIPKDEEMAPEEIRRQIEAKTKKALALRKEPEEEFFYMTLVAQIMISPMQNALIDIVTDAKAIFLKCKKTAKKDFYDWPKWIQGYLSDVLKEKEHEK